MVSGSVPGAMMARFTLATLGMVALLALAMVLGSPFPVLALLYITVFTLIYALASAMTALAGKKGVDATQKVSVYSLNPKGVSLGRGPWHCLRVAERDVGPEDECRTPWTEF